MAGTLDARCDAGGARRRQAGGAMRPVAALALLAALAGCASTPPIAPPLTITVEASRLPRQSIQLRDRRPSEERRAATPGDLLTGWYSYGDANFRVAPMDHLARHLSRAALDDRRLSGEPRSFRPGLFGYLPIERTTSFTASSDVTVIPVPNVGLIFVSTLQMTSSRGKVFAPAALLRRPPSSGVDRRYCRSINSIL